MGGDYRSGEGSSLSHPILESSWSTVTGTLTGIAVPQPPLLAWAALETRILLFDCYFLCICDKRQRSIQAVDAALRWREYKLTILVNPLYWFAWSCVFACLLAGYGYHRIFGQHGPISIHETITEHEARVWWIYPTVWDPR